MFTGVGMSVAAAEADELAAEPVPVEYNRPFRLRRSMW